MSEDGVRAEQETLPIRRLLIHERTRNMPTPGAKIGYGQVNSDVSTSRGGAQMAKRFDHLTIVVRDIDRAKAFFGLLGFKEAISVIIAGEPFASYMGVPGIEAQHVTLVLENASPRTEIQLLRYLHPDPLPDPHIRDLHKLGMNHICFAVDDIEAEVAKLRASGFKTRNEIMDFHSRKLVFIEGPEGVAVELSQWH
jgi:catechol 2,3-dioxygenase-like lactoylglutathione lyase family enzyme